MGKGVEVGSFVFVGFVFGFEPAAMFELPVGGFGGVAGLVEGFEMVGGGVFEPDREVGRVFAGK